LIQAVVQNFQAPHSNWRLNAGKKEVEAKENFVEAKNQTHQSQTQIQPKETRSP
jgi:hypothetical protein